MFVNLNIYICIQVTSARLPQFFSLEASTPFCAAMHRIHSAMTLCRTTIMQYLGNRETQNVRKQRCRKIECCVECFKTKQTIQFAGAQINMLQNGKNPERDFCDIK